jgi:hypothetical protein
VVEREVQHELFQGFNTYTVRLVLHETIGRRCTFGIENLD